MKHLFLLIFSFCCICGSAQQISLEQATKVARNFADRTSLRSGGESLLRLAYQEKEARTKSSQIHETSLDALYYVFNIGDKQGYVIVSGDYKCLPILAYSEQGEFNDALTPVNMKEWLGGYANQIRHVSVTTKTALPEIQQKWNALLTGTMPLKNTNEVLMQTASWNQHAPYNNLCPEQSVSGCGATAMAIVMKYHLWPQYGKGTANYVSKTNQYHLSADFNVEYDWKNMPNTYFDAFNAPIYTQEESQTVSELMQHCGISIFTDYTKNNSTYAALDDVKNALINNFDYSYGVEVLQRSVVSSSSQWEYDLRSELDNDSPVIYRGAKSNGDGHAFVCDGYNDNFYHFNWGWGGLYNGWFTLSVLAPGNDDYSFEQFMMTRIRPNTTNTVHYYTINSSHADYTIQPTLNQPVGKVREGSDFSFTLYPYSPENIPTVYANDNLLDARNGVYTIRNVNENQNITITSSPTANAYLHISRTLTCLHNVLTITNTDNMNTPLFVYDVAGKIIYQKKRFVQTESIQLPGKGVYYVRLGEGTYSVINR